MAYYQNPLDRRFGERYFKELPTHAGVYFFLSETGSPLYIGKADNLRNRLRSYRLARPGKTPDHTLEMLEEAREIRWEPHPDGMAALRREADLLRALKPPFNIAGVESFPYLIVGLRFAEAKRKGPLWIQSEFHLTEEVRDPDLLHFGRFRFRSKVKTGYAALIRLISAVLVERERFSLPAKLYQPSRLYVHEMPLPEIWRAPLISFFEGKRPTLLRLITERLLEKINIPKFMYAPLKSDLGLAKEFFRIGPRATRQIALIQKTTHRLLSQSEIDDYFARAR